jgi:hypothetical protein
MNENSIIILKIIFCVWCGLGFISFTYWLEKGWRNRDNITFNYSLYLFLLVLNIMFGAFSFFMTTFEISAEPSIKKDNDN